MNARTQQLVEVGQDPPERQVVATPWNPRAVTPMDMLNEAVGQGASIDVLKELMDLQERWDRRQARKAFDAALAAARAELPTIIKNRTVDYQPQGKPRVTYRHEDLAGIAQSVDPVLAAHGLSYRWRTSSAPNEPITVTCIIAHRDGHSEETTLSAGRDNSGGKNDIQSIGSAVTYLQRYTLKAALGIAASHDDDGVAAGGSEHPPIPEIITEAQLIELRALADQVDADEEKFAKFLGVPRLPALPARRFQEAMNELRAFGHQNGRLPR